MSAVHSTSTLSEVAETIDRLLQTYMPHEILVAFDIDMTLIQPDHPALYYPNLKKHYGLYQMALAALTPDQRDYTALLTHLEPQRFVEDTTLETLTSLRKTGVKTICFTAALAGKPVDGLHGHITRRHTVLQTMGLDFSSSFHPSADHIVFSDMASHGGGHPVFYKGILCSNGERHPDVNKGTVLVAFLKHIQPTHTPKVICLVDDRMKNLEDTGEALGTHLPNISFIGLHYQGATSYAPQEISPEDFTLFWERYAELARQQSTSGKL